MQASGRLPPDRADSCGPLLAKGGISYGEGVPSPEKAKSHPACRAAESGTDGSTARWLWIREVHGAWAASSDELRRQAQIKSFSRSKCPEESSFSGITEGSDFLLFGCISFAMHEREQSQPGTIVSDSPHVKDSEAFGGENTSRQRFSSVIISAAFAQPAEENNAIRPAVRSPGDGAVFPHTGELPHAHGLNGCMICHFSLRPAMLPESPISGTPSATFMPKSSHKNTFPTTAVSERLAFRERMLRNVRRFSRKRLPDDSGSRAHKQRA